MDTIEKELQKIKENLQKWNRPEILAACIGHMDLTSLNSTDTKSKIEKMVEKVNNFPVNYPKYPSVAAICVYPNFAEVVKKNLNSQDVNVAVVGGVFPSSQSFLEVKIQECRIAVEKGADEVDIVLSLSHFLEGEYELAAKEISSIKKAIAPAHLKVILETGALSTPEAIEKASVLAMEAGADFIKTSTGKMEPAATPEAAIVMCRAIKEHYRKTGKKVGFKPAGGISTPQDAILYYAIVDTILGEEWLNPELFRLGASRLANNLLTELENRPINYF
ncbi:MAG: deoxyribose-phosphate aldolase [Bacteroidales bacterium]|jgi:deoxyribose-phosphate aldolase|nr:deoxyribose-phosphate aldolase [Bacteroidales bacterium]MDD2280841.1 deoxyribose-phosphate aldolase [Bacteroidales bacterium]MDD4293330.1 deoxyribose-phosphate aldolase [Bacteroidales bacterium]MDD4492412.1 deoxyribose-phosphate aldolase [Bacteroidales bacterium]HPS96071.1 deoxyribose-phosphate aldolase [Bacteroidales bacterium]